MRLAFLALALAVAAAPFAAVRAEGPDAPPPPAPAEHLQQIVYATGPCYGSCPVFNFTVSRDGSASLERPNANGTQHDDIKADPQLFAKLAAALAAVRPPEGDRIVDEGTCQPFATDLPSATVIWRDDTGISQSLYFSYGCMATDEQATGLALRKAAMLLPIP